MKVDLGVFIRIWDRCRSRAQGSDAGCLLSRDHRAQPGWLRRLFPDLPGCTAAGDTVAEAAINAEEALAGHLLVSEEHGDELAAPSELRAVEVDPDVDEVARIIVCGESELS